MRKLLGENVTYKLVAIFLAIVLWLNASGQESSLRQLVVEVPLEMRNLSSSLVASEIPETVRVRIEGDRDAVEKVEPSQLSAFVRMDQYEAGSHHVPVQVTIPGGVRLVNVYPDTVPVQLTEMTSVNLPVDVDVEGGVAEGFTMLSPVVNPGQVVVSGPSDVLEKISSARVTVLLNEATQDYNNELSVTLEGVDSARNQLDIEPAAVRVTIPVVQEDQTKTVTIEAVVEGSPPEGFTVGTVTLQPQTINIRGSSGVLSEISGIRTGAINVEGKETSFSETVALTMPQGVQAIGGTEVVVTVEIVAE